MNKLKAALLAAIISYIVTAACSLAAGEPTVLLTDKSSGKTITVYKGNTILLEIASQPDGGYVHDSLSYNRLVLRLVSHHKRSPKAKRRLGQPGEATWKFIAITPGSSALKITAVRPWNKKDKITVYSSVVKVKDQMGNL